MRSQTRLSTRWLAASLALGLTWFHVVPPAFAAQFRVFRKTYVLPKSRTLIALDRFAVLNANTPWRLRAINGDPTNPSVSQVLSAAALLNGVAVLRPEQFNFRTALFEGPVTLRSANALLTLALGKPGSQFTLEILGQDNAPPTAQWLSPSPSQFLNTPAIATQLRLVDEVAGLDPASLQVLLDGATVLGAFTPLTQPTLQTILQASLAPAEGSHALSAQVRDLAGQLAVASVSFTVDRTPPVVSNLSPADSSILDNPRPTIGAGFSDALSGIDVSAVHLMLDGADSTAQATVTDSSISFTPAADLAAGPHTARIDVSDNAGNPTSAQTTFTVDTVAAPPVTPDSGFIHGAVFHALTEVPLADVEITVEGVNGSVRTDGAGGFQFPTPGPGDFVVHVAKPGFTGVQRPISVLATRDIAVAPAYLTPLDGKVTVIEAAQGGVATDASGAFEVTFPPGAAPHDLSVIITPLMEERQLPGPMQPGQGHLIAVNFEPRFTTFNSPASLRIRNERNLLPGTRVNLQLWHEDAQQWQPEQFGEVTADGQWIEFHIIRFFCWYCVWLSLVLPAGAKKPDQPTAVTAESQDPRKSCETPLQSSICVSSGRLSESHSLPGLRTLGTDRTLTFTYHSSAASPSALLGTDYILTTAGIDPTLLPATTTATIQIEGRWLSATFQGAGGPLRQAALWDGRNARGELVPTGAYPYTVALSNDYPATLGGTGLPAMGPSALTTGVASRAVLINERASPFGAGWSLEGLERLYPQPDGTLLLVDGDSSAIVFRLGPQPDLATLGVGTDDVLLLSGHGDGTFQPPQRALLTLNDPPPPVDLPRDLATGDFNEDGWPDLAVAFNRPDEFALLFGEGRSSFAAPQRFAGEPALIAVDSADFNRDGHEDLALLSQGGDAVALLLGRGDGTFEPKRLLATGDAPAAMAVADLTRDGIPDIVVANSGVQNATVLVGVGDGTFQPSPSPAIGQTPTAVVVGDFNADALPDVVVANRLDFNVSLLLGHGDGSFEAPQLVSLAGRAPWALTSGDFNGDGRLDLAVADLVRNTVTLLLATGPAAFQQLPDVATGQGPIALAAVELNQDGRLDLVAANSSGGSLTLFAGDGAGGLQRLRDMPVSFSVIGLLAGEFDDRRGDPDQVFSGLPGEFSQVRKHPDGTYTRQLTNGTQLAFDARGLHSRTTDRVGNVTRYMYDAGDRLIRVEFPGGAAFDLAYSGASGRLASITDSSGRTTQVLVDGVGDLRHITNPDATGRDFAYDAEHRMTRQTNARSFTTDYEYDAFGRIAQATLPARPIFDAVTGAVTSERETRHFLPADTQGLINTLPAGVGTPAHPAPPVPPPLSAFEDGRGNTTQVATDPYGAPTKLIDALGRTTLIDRDVNGLPGRITQPNGAFSTLLYDSRGNLLVHVQRVVDPRSPASFTPVITKFAYESRFNRLTTLTDGRRDSIFEPQHPCVTGCTTSFGYDADGNLTSLTDGVGNVTAFAYDARGLLTTVTDALGTATPAIPDDHQTRFTYDAATGNLLTTLDPLGRMSQLEYDPAGNVSRSVDPQLRSTLFLHDAMNRLRQVTDAALGVTAYTYDAAGNLTRVEDANHQATLFAYDALNQLTQADNPLGEVRAYAYDLSRNLARIHDAKGQELWFRYDAANQLVEKLHKDALGQMQDTTTYAYDALGNLALAQDGDSRLVFGYDSAGRLVQADSGDPANPALPQVRSTLQYSYDGAGNRRGAALALAGLVTNDGPALSYDVDGANRVTGVFMPNTFSRSIAYDPLGRVRQLGGGANMEFQYDDASQLTRLENRVGVSLAEPPIDVFAYAYDPLGNRTSLTDRFGLHQYGYDALNRLLSADHPLASGLTDEGFTYDPVGNRRTSHLSAAYAYNPANRLLEDDQFTYTYDLNGNLATKTDKLTLAVTTYAYNVENQLTRIDLPGGQLATYRYDALGRRTEKAVNGAATRYVYDGEDMWSQVDVPRNCPTHLYFHGPGMDQPLGFLLDQEGDCNFITSAGFTEPAVMLQTDGLGSITTLLNQTRGFFRSPFLAERITYDSFGTPTFQNPGPDGRADTADDLVSDHSAFGSPYAFTGREWDPESGLYYVRARYYDPKTGRFLQEDPLRAYSGPNYYLYAENNPNRWIDPLGLLPRKGKYKIPFTGIGVDYEEVWPETRNGIRNELSSRLPQEFPPIPGQTREETVDELATAFTDELSTGEGLKLKGVLKEMEGCPIGSVERQESRSRAQGIVEQVLERVKGKKPTWPWNEWDLHFKALRTTND